MIVKSMLVKSSTWGWRAKRRSRRPLSDRICSSLFEGRSTFAPSFQLTQPPTFCHQCGAISSLSLPFLPTSFQSSPLWAIPASPVATTKQWGSPLIQVFQSVPKPWRGANPFRTCTWCPTTPCHRHPLNHHPSPCPLRTSIGNMKMRLLHRR